MITSKSLGYNKTVGVNDLEILIKDIPFGIHDLTLRLLNKEEQDTVVTDDGQIIDDLYAVIESLEIDHYDFMYKIDLISDYHDNHGNQIQTYGWLSFPQDFKLWFQVPGWYFARNLSVIPEEKIKHYLSSASTSMKI